MEGTEFYGIGIVPVIVALSEAVKRAGLNIKLIPLFNIILGLIAGFAFYPDIKQAILIGMAFGLSAGGLYSGVKKATEKEI